MEMNFKDAYQDDLANLFFDEEELASRHNIDGVEYTIILMDMEKQGSRKYYGRAKSTFNQKETAINLVKYIVYIRECDVKRKLTTNALINLDGKKCFIQDVWLQEGIYILTLGIYAV